MMQQFSYLNNIYLQSMNIQVNKIIKVNAFKLDKLILKYFKLKDEIINDEEKINIIEKQFWKDKYYSG